MYRPSPTSCRAVPISPTRLALAAMLSSRGLASAQARARSCAGLLRIWLMIDVVCLAPQVLVPTRMPSPTICRVVAAKPW
ncbi:hypothetical protein D3C76_1464030 [compost metagenome]